MYTPNKIYIAVYPNDDGLDTHLGDWYSEPEFHAEDNLEYIHKDALIEWLKECFRLQDGGSWYSKGAADAFSKVIDKLNSM